MPLSFWAVYDVAGSRLDSFLGRRTERAAVLTELCCELPPRTMRLSLPYSLPTATFACYPPALGGLLADVGGF